MTPSKTLVSCCLALCLAVAACEAASYPYLFAFGDSWVDDNGVQGAFKAFGAPPSPPNAWRFSNGPTWPRFLAEEVGISCNWTESDTAAGLNCTNYKNYAMGGACAADWNDNAAVEEYCEVGPNNDLTNNLDAQIQLFLAEGFASQVINDALFAISIGGNDMNGIVNADGGFTDKAENLQGGDDKVLDAIEAGITALHNAGMRNLLILNLPPILITPRAIALDLNIAEYQFVDEYLESYSEDANELFEEIDLAGLTITQGNLRGCLRELEVGKYGGMEGAGFDNWVDACIDDRNDPDSPVCDTPETYFFFDDIHPTTAAHQWIGGELAKALDGGSPDDVCMLSECFGDSLLDSCFNAAGLVVPSLLAVAGAAVAAFLA